jgi:hypothetical protein
LRASDSTARTTTELPEENGTSGTKRKAQTSQVRNEKTLQPMNFIQRTELFLDEETKKISCIKFKTYAIIR